jgi:predicted Zn-dependent protease
MPDFFQRLQRVMGISDNSVPAYVRTHPLTSERIADMQDRVSHVPPHKVPNTPEYARARARVIQEPTPNDVRNVLAVFQAQVNSNTSAVRLPAVYYGIAFANQRLGRFADAEKALAEARRLYGNIPGATSGSPMLDVMAVELARAEGGRRMR